MFLIVPVFPQKVEFPQAYIESVRKGGIPMKLSEAEELICELMERHELFDECWSYQFDAASVRFGECRQRDKVLSFSKKLVYLNHESDVRDTILHEIAHALVGTGHGHSEVWSRKCVEIGVSPNRYYSSREIAGVRNRTAWLIADRRYGGME